MQYSASTEFLFLVIAKMAQWLDWPIQNKKVPGTEPRSCISKVTQWQLLATMDNCTVAEKEQFLSVEKINRGGKGLVQVIFDHGPKFLLVNQCQLRLGPMIVPEPIVWSVQRENTFCNTQLNNDAKAIANTRMPRILNLFQ